MSHKWVYRGEGNYGCQKCGQEADKSNVADISRQDCPGDAGNETRLSLASLAIAVEALNTRLEEVEEKQEVHR